jgi:hypothetical protein
MLGNSCGSKAARDCLARLLDDPDAGVREVAQWSLDDLGDPAGFHDAE